MKVRDLANDAPLQVSPGLSLDRAMATMEEHEMRHLVVVEEGRVVGVVSDRDLLEATGWVFQAEGAETPPRPVREVMSAPAVSAAPDAPLLEVVHTLLERGLGCIPLVEGDALVGVLSEVDVLAGFRDAARRGKLALLMAPFTFQLFKSRHFSQAARQFASHGAVFCSKGLQLGLR